MQSRHTFFVDADDGGSGGGGGGGAGPLATRADFEAAKRKLDAASGAGLVSAAEAGAQLARLIERIDVGRPRARRRAPRQP